MLVALALALRPLLAIDETRYLSVAWEMWLRHDWLVPYLNGTLSRQATAPLLGHAARLAHLRGQPVVAPAPAAVLWSGQRAAAGAADAEARAGGLRADRTLPFLSGLLWVTYSTLVLFDTLLTACVLLALLGLVEAGAERERAGMDGLRRRHGPGLLAKGPVVLIPCCRWRC